MCSKSTFIVIKCVVHPEMMCMESKITVIKGECSTDFIAATEIAWLYTEYSAITNVSLEPFTDYQRM